MQNTFANALSETISKHMPLSATRRETLAWLALLIMRHGTICLWRLAAHVATMATIDSVRRRFYRLRKRKRAHLEPLGRRNARQSALDDSSHHSLAKIIGKRHSRRLLHAAGIMNQNATDSGSPRDSVCSEPALL